MKLFIAQVKLFFHLIKHNLYALQLGLLPPHQDIIYRSINTNKIIKIECTCEKVFYGEEYKWLKKPDTEEIFKTK